MERLRIEREEWESEASKERERREAAEDEMAGMERREMENQREWERGREELQAERERADNLQEVLSEFQTGELVCRSQGWRRQTDKQQKTGSFGKLQKSWKRS